MTYQPEKARGRLFRRGDRVTIASREEVLASLDADASLDAMPFMPQMLELCGTSHIVDSLAHKSCDTIDGSGGLELSDTVHLQGVRCDGRAYDGCQAGCLIFWKTDWLRPYAGEPETPVDTTAAVDGRLAAATLARPGANPKVYRCQATQLKKASRALPWYDVAQYYRDWRDNGVPLTALVRAFGFFLFRQTLKLGAFRAQVNLFNRWQALTGGEPFPFRQGQLDKTPSESLDLKPGELVRVRSHDEILATLDKRNRNRGLSFDAEMVKFCGGTFRVQEAVTHIINEKTGVMMQFGTPGIILESVYCTSRVSSCRLFCPRKIHHYWREIWLERLEPPAS